MTDNQFPTGTLLHGLPDHTLARLCGPDALAFAQAQFANDVKLLSDGHWQWNCWLTPKGRVIAIFVLARINGTELLAVLPDVPATNFAQALSRFIFRRKVHIEACTDIKIAANFASPSQATGAHLAHVEDCWEFDVGNRTIPRTWRLAPSAAVGDADAAMLARWKAVDLAFGLPRLDEPAREQWTPQQLSLERLHAFSMKKNCYPGQEIVARTHFLGKSKRGLALFSADIPPKPGEQLFDGDTQIGSIISTALAPAAIALAVVSLEAMPGRPHAGQARLEPQPLIDGLAR